MRPGGGLDRNAGNRAQPRAHAPAGSDAKQVFSTLNGIRGIAAGLIVIRHATLLFPGWYFPNSYLAVDLFFVMSGFVMASAYDARLNGDLTPTRFVGIRLIRLYPLYLLGLALGAGAVLMRWMLDPATGRDDPGLLVSIALALVILPNPMRWNDHIFPLNAPSWSLFFELVVNILYAAAHRAITTPRLILFVVLSGMSLGVLTGWGLRPEEGHSWNEYLGVGLARVCYGFGAGLLLFRLRGRSVKSSVLAILLLVLVAATLATPALGPVQTMAVASLWLPALVFAAAHVEPLSAVRAVFEVARANFLPDLHASRPGRDARRAAALCRRATASCGKGWPLSRSWRSCPPGRTGATTGRCGAGSSGSRTVARRGERTTARRDQTSSPTPDKSATKP